MLSYFLEDKKSQKVKKNTQIAKANKGKLILSSKCAVCDYKKLEIYRKTRSKWFAKLVKIKTLLSKITLLGDISF